jgi:hypothetical protein
VARLDDLPTRAPGPPFWRRRFASYKQRAFRQRLTDSGITCKFFSNVHQLQADVEAAVREIVDGGSGRAEDPTKYLQTLRELSGSIDIRGLDLGIGRARRLPLDEFYITLTTAAAGDMAENRAAQVRSPEDAGPARVPLHDRTAAPPRRSYPSVPA